MSDENFALLKELYESRRDHDCDTCDQNGECHTQDLFEQYPTLEHLLTELFTQAGFMKIEPTINYQVTWAGEARTEIDDRLRDTIGHRFETLVERSMKSVAQEVLDIGEKAKASILNDLNESLDACQKNSDEHIPKN